MDLLHAWMINQRDLVPEGSAISRALDYSLKRWAALSRSGKRAAAIMSLIPSARLNGHDPYAYLKDVLMRLPTQASEIDQLLPHKWQPA